MTLKFTILTPITQESYPKKNKDVGKKLMFWEFPVVHTFTAEGLGSNPGWEL